MNTIGLVVHIGREKAAKLAERLVIFLKKRSVQVRLLEGDAEATGHPELGVSAESFASDLDLAVVLGGDGTVLRTARLLKGENVPILGVNLGRLGFLAEIEEKALEPTLEKVLDGRFELEKRMLLECEVINGSSIQQALALNEIVVERGSYPKLLELDVFINGDFFIRYACDGLIFATPTGSTAYSLSASGPIVSPDTRLILMTPISPHSFFNRSVVLGEKDKVEIFLVDPEKRSARISIDGVPAGDDCCFKKLLVCVSSKTVDLVKPEKRTFYQILREKLKVWDVFDGNRPSPEK